MNASIDYAIFTFHRHDNRLSLFTIRANGTNQVVVDMNVPASVIAFHTHQLNTAVAVAAFMDSSRLIVDVLESSFDLMRTENNDGVDFRRKMAVMVTDFTLNIGVHCPAFLAELNRRRIPLTVVGTVTTVFAIWDPYRTMALNTGGEYVLLQNAGLRLARTLSSIIYDEDAHPQAFQHMQPVNIHLVPNQISTINGQCAVSDGVGDLPFDHGLSE